MKESKLFVYGQLKPGSKYEPHVLAKPIKSTIKADMYKVGKDAAVKNVGKSKNVADGFTLRVPTAKLKAIDKMESPQFKRVKTTDSKGDAVWTYEYKKTVGGDKKIKDFRK